MSDIEKNTLELMDEALSGASGGADSADGKSADLTFTYCIGDLNYEPKRHVLWQVVAAKSLPELLKYMSCQEAINASYEIAGAIDDKYFKTPQPCGCFATVDVTIENRKITKIEVTLSFSI